MKILMLAPQPFFEPRGTPISVYQRLEALSSLGHEIDLVTYHVGADVQIPNVRVWRIPRVWWIQDVPIGPSWAKPLLDFLLFCVATLRLFTTRYDVIHSHEEAAFFAIILGSIFRIPHIYDMHSSLPQQLENFQLGNWRPLIDLFRWLERITLKTCHAVITIDAELEQYVTSVNPGVRHMRIENHAIEVKRNLVDSELISRLKEQSEFHRRQLVVYTGTFERYQGLDLLLQCARLVKERNPRALFVLVGGKPLQIARLADIAQREGVEDCVEFIGIVPPDEAIGFLDLADVLVSPRTGGAFAPLKIYSYLFSGKAMVATRVPAHAEILDEQNALLVQPTQEALADGILLLLGNKNLRDTLGRQAQQVAMERKENAEYSSRLEQIYRSLRTYTPAPGRAQAQIEKVKT